MKIGEIWKLKNMECSKWEENPYYPYVKIKKFVAESVMFYPFNLSEFELWSFESRRAVIGMGRKRFLSNYKKVYEAQNESR